MTSVTITAKPMDVVDAFIDPRANPAPSASKSSAWTTNDPDELTELRRLCREGRLYEVERWIKAGRPLQLSKEIFATRRRAASALEIALEAGSHGLVQLLLCNGYDPNLERESPLNVALRSRRFDLLDILLEWGADPHEVDLGDLFDTYNSRVFTRFRELGVDLTEGHALAGALAYHTANKPLFGFARRHRAGDSRIQRELNIALAHHAGRGNEKGVSLCLWAGADPHAPAPSLGYPNDLQDDDSNGANRFLGFSAVNEACRYGDAEILQRLGPDPLRDDFDELYGVAGSSAVVDLLARSALPQDLGGVIAHRLWFLPFEQRAWPTLDVIRGLFEAGARWQDSSTEQIAGIRQSLRRSSDQFFVDLMKLLTTDDYCAPDILKALARTPAIRARMRDVGFIRADDPKRFNQLRPTRSREVLKKCGVVIQRSNEPARPLPRTLTIGGRGPTDREIRLSRAELFDRVWSQPLATLADAWGLSGPGLAKACRRLRLPVPPRGYWAKVEAGKRVHRARLPQLPEGEAEEIVIWAPDRGYSTPSLGSRSPTARPN